jgi:hypothetical protein
MDIPKGHELGVGMGLILFLLALIYCFTDYSSIFDKNDYVGKYKSAVKYAFAFCFDYVGIVFKVMLVLLFIYIFIVIYNIAIVAIFKPLLSDNVGSNESVNGFNSAREIIEQARISYFSMIKTVAINTMRVVFGFINIPNTLLLLFVIIPIYLLFAVFSYYHFISNKQNVEKEKSKEQKILTSTYHYFMILIFTIIVMFAIYMIYKTLEARVI